ncbi:hypothetical protein TR51_25565 [Kitasatospora griseola]|uniref:Uncharacterized protein n=1 Tax=Kitasatospora griseola TaxID=2064 RepID=A0A0D0N2W3_KITGR|nr:hypothetical protein [Kitasatospora griseola]KIQ62410.1 hypothetical protein TR51_25565 [Kitasatospora griseola]
MSEIQLIRVGKAGTVHASIDGETSLCGKPASGKITNPAAVIGCKACDKAAKAATIENTENKGEPTVTENTNTETATDDPKANLETIFAELEKLNKGDAEKIGALVAQGKTELQNIKSAAQRAPFSMRLKEAEAKAKERPSNSVVLRAATEDITTIDGYEEIVNNAAARAADGIKAEVSAQETARTVAEAILDGRLRVVNKQGLPDIDGKRQASKDLASNIYTRTAEMLAEQGYGSSVADADELIKNLQDKVQYQMTAVIPAFIRSLDNSPKEFAELFPTVAAKLDEGTNPSDAIFDLYGVNRLSKAELAAERRRKAKELASGENVGGTVSTEGDSEGSGESAAPAAAETEAQKLARIFERANKMVTKMKTETDDINAEDALKLHGELMKLLGDVQPLALALVKRFNSAAN